MRKKRRFLREWQSASETRKPLLWMKGSCVRTSQGPNGRSGMMMILKPLAGSLLTLIGVWKPLRFGALRKNTENRPPVCEVEPGLSLRGVHCAEMTLASGRERMKDMTGTNTKRGVSSRKRSGPGVWKKAKEKGAHPDTREHPTTSS